MTLITFLGGANKDIVNMTTGTFRLLVFALQGEKIGVIEVAHPVCAIMAIQAGGSELSDVFLHEDRLLRLLIWSELARMTGDAGLDIELVHAPWMATLAGEWTFVVISRMPRQTETGVRYMIKGLTIQCGRLPRIHTVAGRAVLTKHIAMRIRFSVTACAIHR